MQCRAILRAGALAFGWLLVAAPAAAQARPAARAKPPDSAQLTQLGHVQLAAGNLEEAEVLLLRALELDPVNALAAEDLARIAMKRGHYESAVRFVDRSLRVERDNPPLWLLRADAASQLGDWRGAAESLEAALTLQDDLPQRTRLARLYLDHNRPDEALRHVKLALPSLPREPKALESHAEMLDALKQGDEALGLWRRVIELAPKREPAHYACARLLYENDDAAGAVSAVERASAAGVSSARLSFVKSRALDKLGRSYEARRMLRTAAAGATDADVLRQAAEVEDQYGLDAPESYKRLVSALEASKGAPADVAALAERGRVVSLRDRSPENAAWFESRLRASEAPAASRTKAAVRTPDTVAVPGGLRPLLALLHGRERVPPERFFLEYAQAVVSLQPAPKLADTVSEHFRRVQALQALGQRQGLRVALAVSTRDKAERKAAESVLKLLGWEMKSSGGRVSVEAREGDSAADRQLTTDLLGIDALAMEKALRRGEAFAFEVNDEGAPVVLGEAAWRAEFHRGKESAGALALAMAEDPRLARLYAGLAVLDEATRTALLSGTGLKDLAEDCSDLVYAYAPALVATGGQAVVPGGPRAEPIWERLAGAAAANPARFFRALLRKDDGRLLAFFSTLSQMDEDHQRFFTDNAARTARFYDLFKDAPDLDRGAGASWRSAPFISFLAELPLTDDGHVRFPGSPEVWMVAKGQSSSASATNKLLKKLSRVAAPDVEDEILLRLARTAYGAEGGDRSQLDNFLAVARLDAHRREPLDEASALMLAQGFARWEHAWPYLSLLTGLGRDEIAAWAALEQKLGSLQGGVELGGVELSVRVGQLHALLQLLGLARQAEAIGEKESTELFALLCKRHAAADSPSAFAAASLAVARALVERISRMAPPAGADDAMRTVLAGPESAPTVVPLPDGQLREADGAGARHRAFRRVLELQGVPSLATLLDLDQAVQALVAGTGDAARHATTIHAVVASLPDTQVPKTAKGVYEDTLKAYAKGEILEKEDRLQKAIGKRKPRPQEIAERATELLAETNPMVTLGLAGLVYAYYLRPEDLLVSEDPLLLRKHQYLMLDPQRKKTNLVFLGSWLQQRGESGSWPQGGLGDFSNVAGRIAMLGMRGAGGTAEEFVVRQIGFLRSTRWDKVDDRELRLVGLRVRAGREWIVHAGLHPDAASELAAATLGLVSLSRRAQLLRAVGEGDWDSAWAAVSLSDAYFLGKAFVAMHASDPWPSPTLRALRAATSQEDPSRVQWLGPDLDLVNNCSHPHLLRLLPYEHYARFQLPDRLAIRAGEFKLYLAEFLDRESVPAAALPTVAEPLARKLLDGLSLADIRDWPSTGAAYARLGGELLSEALQP